LEEVVLRIDSLAAGGDGVGRAPDGRVVFVPLCAPGDRVRVRLEESRARFARGRVLELLEPGPSRTEPGCPAFGRCGGCAWQHVDYGAQLAAKQRIASDALARIGGLALPEPLGVLPSPRPYGYRLRARLRVEGGLVGYRERGSHALCAVSQCPILLPELERRLAELAASPPAQGGEWELACAGGRTRAAPLAERGSAPALALEVAGERVGFSPGVFAQANALLLEPLVARVREAAGAGRLALELFAGSGLFTLPLARRFARVVAVESQRAAVRDLRANLAAAGLRHVEVVARRVEDAGPALAGLAPEVVLLDPPRAGLPRGAVDLLARLAPARIAYLSCDPATLARDLRRLLGRGYRLRHAEGFDLFPQTPHIEVLALLERAPQASEGGKS
jgi:23S rRNA (uracil1939-C5)-methyltransferase